LRRSAIIALIAGVLTLIAAVVIASIDLQNPSAQSSSAPLVVPQKGLLEKAPSNTYKK